MQNRAVRMRITGAVLLAFAAAGCAHEYVVRVLHDGKSMPGAVAHFRDASGTADGPDSGLGYADESGYFRFSSAADCVSVESAAGSNLWGRATLVGDSDGWAQMLHLERNPRAYANFFARYGHACPPRAVEPVCPPPEPVHPPAVTGPMRAYAVKEGEDLYAVAIRWGVSPSELKAINHLTGPDLRPGQVLRIPASADAGF